MKHAVWCFCAAVTAGAAAMACDSGSVRDAALRAKRDMHRLCLFASRDDASAQPIYARLESWLAAEGTHLNVKLERVNADDASVDWRSYGIPSAPPKMPVVALIGEFVRPRRVFVIEHWEPAPTEADLAALRTSAVRESLKSAVVDTYAAILYSPDSAGGAKEPVINAVIAAWQEKQPAGLTLVKLDRAEPEERMLCSFAGIEPAGPDWAGVVFGKGKLMAPPLQGNEISEAGLNSLLDRLTAPCTCLTESISYGLDIPLSWEPEMDLRVASAVPMQTYFEQTLGPSGESRPAARVNEVPEDDARVTMAVVIALAAGAGVALGAIVAAGMRYRRQRI